LFGAVAAAMCATSLVSPATADADAPCAQWRFDGYAQFDFRDGGKVTFFAFTSNLFQDPPIPTVAIPPDGGSAVHGTIVGAIGGNAMYGHYSGSQGTVEFRGGVTDDGFAYGIAYDDARHTSGSWRSAAPLRCADNDA
jgi:hypothetical protein